MPTIAEISQRDHYECAYVLFIEGIEYAFATLHSDNALLGSGSGSWIYGYETEASVLAWEASGTRTVLPGLAIPKKLPRGRMDPKTGMPQRTSTNFEILDIDGTVGQLFATEGKDERFIHELIPAGTVALSSSVQSSDPSGTSSSFDKHIGIERIGPAGERRFHYCYPFQGIGLEHTAVPSDLIANGMTISAISDEPVQFAGRHCCLYKIIRQEDGTWPNWLEQYDSGVSLVWQGRMRDHGEFQGDKKWRIQCDGFESYMHKRLGAGVHNTWQKISSVIKPVSEQNGKLAIRLCFATQGDAGTGLPGALYLCNAVGYEYNTSPFASPAFVSLNKHSIIDQINLSINDLKDGSGSEFSGTDTAAGDEFNDEWNGSRVGGRFEFRSNGAILFGKEDQDQNGAVFGATVAFISMHVSAWRAMGFEPEAMAASFDDPETPFSALLFSKLEKGSTSGLGTPTGWSAVPGDDYWELRLDSSGPETSFQQIMNPAFATNNGDNGGVPKLILPVFQGSPEVLQVGSTFKVDKEPIYVPKALQSVSVGYQLLDPAGSNISQADSSRAFVFRGKRATGSAAEVAAQGNEGIEIEAEEIYQVGIVSFDEAHPGIAASQSFVLDQWLDPKPFGLDYRAITGEWISLAPDYQIECAPLVSFDLAGKAYERANNLFTSLLCSTGSAGGWSDTLLDGWVLSYSYGENDPPNTTGALEDGGDIYGADQGLGIPYQLIQDVRDIRDVFEEATGGIDEPLNRARVAYVGSKDSMPLIESLLRTRGLAVSFDGGKIGVQKLEIHDPLESSVIIDESSVWAPPGNPAAAVPSQTMRATGPIDRVDISYRWSPEKGGPALKQSFHSMDAGSSYRTGQMVDKIENHELIPSEWYQKEGEQNYTIFNAEWVRAAREVHSMHRPRFFARRHFTIDGLKIITRVGQQLHMGTKVRFTNPWVATPAGTYGVTDVSGLCLRADLVPSKEHYDVDLLIFAENFSPMPRFMPIGKIASVSGVNVTLESDWANHRQGDDASKFERPGYSTALTSTVCRVMYYDRSEWQFSTDMEIQSIAGNVISMDAFPSDVNPRTDMWLVMDDYATQTAENWVLELGCPITEDDGQHGGGLNIDGVKLIE